MPPPYLLDRVVGGDEEVNQALVNLGFKSPAFFALLNYETTALGKTSKFRVDLFINQWQRVTVGYSIVVLRGCASLPFRT